jgi:hypothetical protein
MNVFLSEESASDTVGIIFPLLRGHAERFLSESKTVFVKFFGKGRMPLRLRPGSKLFLYESQSKKEIVGEAKVVRVESMPASSVMSVYGDKVFLNETEFKDYVGLRMDRTMLVLVLADPKRYSVPLKLDKSVTMAGQYMTREMYVYLCERSGKSN